MSGEECFNNNGYSLITCLIRKQKLSHALNSVKNSQYCQTQRDTLLLMESASEGHKQPPRELPSMFRPPVHRAMRTLDRSFFRKIIPLSVAKVFQNSDISRLRTELSKSRDLLVAPRVNCVRNVEDQDGLVRKALLLRGNLTYDGRWRWLLQVERSLEWLRIVQTRLLGHRKLVNWLRRGLWLWALMTWSWIMISGPMVCSLRVLDGYWYSDLL